MWKVGEEREREMLFHLFMNSLVDSGICPGWGLNPQPWHISDDAPTT